MKDVAVVLLCTLIFFVAIFALQFFLSRRQSKLPGLILPILTFIYSLIVVLSFANLSNMTIGQFVGQLLVTFLASNVPTAIFLIIYFACREKKKRAAQLEKMNIQDLD